MKYLDLTNKKFGKLTALERISSKNNKVVWKCLCDCGKITYVLTTNLTCGRTKSCGCLKDEKLIQRSTKHNQRHTKLYEIWKSMKQRCFNPNNSSFHRYGGRGIIVCDDWKNNFSSFYDWSMTNGYSQNLSLDRIDNNSNYCPENCRWTDKLTQANNTRTNRYFVYKNQTKTIAEWSRFFNISYKNLYIKLQKNNFDAERTFSKISIKKEG